MRSRNSFMISSSFSALCPAVGISGPILTVTPAGRINRDSGLRIPYAPSI